MPVYTDLYSCAVDHSLLKDAGFIKNLLNKVKEAFANVGLDKSTEVVHSDKAGFLVLLYGSDGRNATVQGHPEGTITTNVQWTSLESNKTSANDISQKLEEELRQIFKSKKLKRYPTFIRGGSINPYLPSADGRLLEYDFTEVLFEQQTEYQHVLIMKSRQYGNALVLDGDLNLAESDLAYTKAITGNGKEDFKDKEILILGGGDGGILHELLKHDPKFVTMVEIDQAVIDGARQHLRGICHDCLDSLTGSNYQVLVKDCIPVLEQYVESGKTFDFVINDLTATPITLEPRGSEWDFMRLILDLSMKVLKKTGKYYTQGNSLNMTSSLAMYEDQLKALSCAVEFKKEVICVPSYLEMWVFYEIWKS